MIKLLFLLALTCLAISAIVWTLIKLYYFIRKESNNELAMIEEHKRELIEHENILEAQLIKLENLTKKDRINEE